MSLIKEFDQIGKGDAHEAGGKGASLGEMTQAGIPVPPGFVILASAFERFIEETSLTDEIDTVLHTVKTDEMSSVEHASEKIQKLILGAQMPDDIGKEIERYFKELDTSFVAVRSSATAEDSASAAWAGQLDSYLNTTEETLLVNVQRCWASLFTPRAIFYRFEKELHKQKISVAVVVQKMVESEVSGIAFSVHPVTEDRNQLIIEAGFGLGEAIVSGQVTPDSYVIEKNPRRIIEKNITYQSRALWRAENGGNEWRELSEVEGNKPTLTDKQALELSEIILHIENHYGFPCDIEWAYEAGTFHITQSRPITTLAPKTMGGEDVKKNLIEDIKNTDWHSDWSGPFSLFGLSLPTNTYFGGMEKYFGKGLSSVFVVFKNGIAFSRLPNDEYHKLGEYLIEKAQDKKFVKEWASQFKKTADKIIKEISVSAEQYIKKLPELLPYYQAYGAYNVATKIVFDVGYDKLSKETKDILEEARKYSETFYKEDALQLEKAMDFIAQKSGYPASEIFMLTYDELRTYLDTGSLPSHDTLKERWTASGVYFERGKTTILSPSELAQIENARLMGVNQTELKGQTAYKGKVQGKCRIVLDYKNAVLERGEVLVTGMTDPHFVELMKRAAAIVTDGGGMLSHAAIVARELKTPCVIGTKIATQVLHDGDLVEVDADDGVIRILQSIGISGGNDYAFMWSTGPNTIVQWASATSVQNRRDIIPIDISMMSYFDGDTMSTYVPASDLRKVREEVSPRFLDPKNFETYKRKYLKETDNWWKWVRDVETRDFSKARTEDLVPVYEQFAQNVYDSIAHFWMSRPEVTSAVEQRLEDILKKHDANKYLDNLGALVTSTEPDDIQLEQIAFKKLIVSGVDDEKLLHHLSKFPWLVFGQFNESEALVFLRECITEIQNHPQAEENERESLLKKQQAILTTLPNEEQKEAEYLSGYLQYMSTERMAIKSYWAGCFWLCRNILKCIAELAHISIADMLGYVSPPEIVSFLSGKLSSDTLKQRIQIRHKSYMIIRPKGGVLRIVDGAEAGKLFKENIRPVSTGITEIHGQTASRGSYTGKIRKVKVGDLADLQASIQEFKKGEILVTSMTQPNMMILANRAGAIIADEGGIASHAAIISRELHIPCIVGCSHAMQVLNDGDLVKVDADNGIITIIK